MPVTDRDGGVAWSEIRAAVLAQRRTLRMLGEATREIASSTLRGDELGIAVLPYAVLGLERAIQTQYKQEEYGLGEKQLQIIGEAAALSAGGAQDAAAAYVAAVRILADGAMNGWICQRHPGATG